MLPDAILFDLDETLLRYGLTPELAWKEACENSKRELKTLRIDELINMIDSIRDWYWSDAERHRAGRMNLHVARTNIVEMALKKLGCANERLADKIATDYFNLREASLGFCPNAEDTVQELLKKEIKLALLTNGAGEIQQAKIARFRLARYFHICLIEGELGYGKPDRRIFETALNKLNVQPDQTWMVGDDIERDITGAKKLGIHSIWCDYEKKGLPDNLRIVPDRIINSITELLVI